MVFLFTLHSFIFLRILHTGSGCLPAIHHITILHLTKWNIAYQIYSVNEESDNHFSLLFIDNTKIYLLTYGNGFRIFSVTPISQNSARFCVKIWEWQIQPFSCLLHLFTRNNYAKMEQQESVKICHRTNDIQFHRCISMSGVFAVQLAQQILGLTRD